ncbi:hypothetical protein SLS53_007214 [Cytospora paraplurivora]|uniref:DUF6546 domain-containing protein n=1 Tax=Cytospora paraplurivora TaxID=2898453 RepID=A0AAN9YE18_9PEZI
MFARFPRLQEVHYEPWREWDEGFQMLTDRDYLYLFESIHRLNTDLKSVVIFENFNQQYPAIIQRYLRRGGMTGCDSLRKPAPAVGRSVALASLNLEHLAASYIADASHFFEIEASWRWLNLSSLVLTSILLTPNEDPTKIGAMLQAAAAAAMKMPQLDTMEIWNGRKGLASLFKYQAFRKTQQATITWRATWTLTMKPAVIQAWEAVILMYDGWRLDVVQERLDGAAINSHGDAIEYLMLSGQIIRPISLHQILMEQRAMEDMETV